MAAADRYHRTLLTGHGGRLGSFGGPSNLYLEPGKPTPNELVQDISRGILVADVMGGKADITSGGYSNGASGHLIENGQITRPIKEVTIASTLLDMFNTLTPANDLSFKYLVNSPTVRVDFMTVAKSLRRYRQTRGLDALPTHNETEPLVAKTRGNGPISSTRHIRRIVQDCFDRAYERMRADRLEDDVLDLRDNDTVYIYSIVMAAFASGSSSCKYWFFDDSD